MYTAPGTWWGEAPVFAFFDFLRYNFVLASLKKKKIIHLAAPGFSGGKWSQVPRPGIEPRPPALAEGRVLCHWSTRNALGLASSRGLLHVLLGEFSPQLEARRENRRGFSKPPEEEERLSEREGHPGEDRSGQEAGRLLLVSLKPQTSVLSHPRDGQSPEPKTFSSTNFPLPRPSRRI